MAWMYVPSGTTSWSGQSELTFGATLWNEDMRASFMHSSKPGEWKSLWELVLACSLLRPKSISVNRLCKQVLEVRYGIEATPSPNCRSPSLESKDLSV